MYKYGSYSIFFIILFFIISLFLSFCLKRGSLLSLFFFALKNKFKKKCK